MSEPAAQGPATQGSAAQGPASQGPAASDGRAGAAARTPGGPPEPPPDRQPVIHVAGVSKRFRRTLPGDRLRTLKSALVGGLHTRDLPREETIPALEEVSFEVARGESFGLIGGNGSGKSTLLKLVAGMLRPTTGELAVEGRVAALIELGSGFHPEISGRENVYINGAVLGLSRRQIDRRYREIVEFSGLADFMEEPVKNYSSGMYVRLGFAVAIHTDPDVLLVDEVLAVGDEAFAHRCIRRIEEFLAAGRTLLLVSHSLDLVAELCDRVLWLDRGHQRLTGDPRRVIDAYLQAVAEEEGAEHLAAARANQEEAAGEVLRWGSGQAEITTVRLLGPDGSERYHLQSGDRAVFEIHARAARPLTDFVFGIAVNTPRGFECWGTNTDLAGFVPGELAGEVVVRVTCPALRLAPGEYSVDVAIHRRDGAPYDYRRRALGFTVTAATGGVGVYFPEHRWEFTGGVSWGSAAARSPRSEP
ncbi:MAG TPA: ABC transporter ATP-binding protein [Thermoanaerobaculia bacterium]|jgi:ABC-type polysaccharide/polyol phosphate transport system ATPase subunit|nr:ABC transporter ATP-binding protein [Thermoanaerobaculia bacterium]